MAKRNAPVVPKVEKKVIPLKEKPGYCRECAGFTFKLYFQNRELLRKCRSCGDEIKI